MRRAGLPEGPVAMVRDQNNMQVLDSLTAQAEAYGLSAGQPLRDVLARGDLSPRDVLRTRDKAYKELGLADESVSDAALISALVEHPGLLQRPIVVKGDRAVLGRPIENVRQLF